LRWALQEAGPALPDLLLQDKSGGETNLVALAPDVHVDAGGNLQDLNQELSKHEND
jgi:hypothetical protein